MKITDNIGSPLLDRITLIVCGVLFLFLGVKGVQDMRETFLNYSSVRISSAWYAFAILPPLITIGAALSLPTQYLIWKKGLLTNILLFVCLLSGGTSPMLYIIYDYEHNIHMTSPVTQERLQHGAPPNPHSPSAQGVGVR
jgi:hypothetical protein